MRIQILILSLPNDQLKFLIPILIQIQQPTRKKEKKSAFTKHLAQPFVIKMHNTVSIIALSFPHQEILKKCVLTFFKKYILLLRIKPSLTIKFSHYTI